MSTHATTNRPRARLTPVLVFLAAAMLLALRGGAVHAGFEGKITTRHVRADAGAIKRIVPEAEPGQQATLAQVPAERFASAGGKGVRIRKTVISVKGDWARFDMDDPGTPGFMVIHLADRVGFFCTPAQKQCMKMSPEDRVQADQQMAQMNAALREAMKSANLTPEQMAALPGNLGQPKPEARVPLEVEATGKNETVMGKKTSVYMTTSGQDVAFGWVTSEAPEISRIYDQATSIAESNVEQDDFDERARKALTAKGLPMKLQYVEAGVNGRATYRADEIVSFEAASIDDAYVKPPSTYAVKTREDMMREAMSGMHPGLGKPPPGAMPSGAVAPQ